MAGDHQRSRPHPLPLETRSDAGSSCPPGGSSRPQSLHGPPEQHAAPSTPPASSTVRLDPPVTGVTASPLVSMETKKQGPAPAQGRRKSGGIPSQQQLRSPVVKRPVSAPVTLQGWLHKQGSEGLMLWKKRWFVLSEYCLFYYKGPEEEKLLGSILLPSYKVSPCTAEDRVYRKFSFKAEHTNMRTYYFAADSRELMVQWMNALSLASILQESVSWDERRSGRPSVSSISSLLNQSADDSDSGFHGYRSRPGMPGARHKGSDEQAKSQLNTSHDSALSNGWPQKHPEGGYHQPLYANAPPKPRRLANELDDYGTPSPDLTPERKLDDTSNKASNPQDEKMKVVNYEPRLAQPQEPMGSLVRNDRGGIDIRYHHHQTGDQQQRVHAPPHAQPQMMQPSVNLAQIVPNTERRTPDTYGRSNSATPAPAVSVKSGGDYEDVYNSGDAARHATADATYAPMYRRSSSQVAYIKGAGPTMSVHQQPQNNPVIGGENPQTGGHFVHSNQQQQQIYASYRYASNMPSQDVQSSNSSSMPQNMYPTPIQQQAQHQHHSHQHQSVQQGRQHTSRSSRHPPRPHSADFLEHDTRRYYQQQAYQQHSLPHPPREHISRDHSLHNASDQQTGKVVRLPRPKSSLDVMPSSDQVQPDSYYWSEESYAQKMRQSASYVHQAPIPAHHRNQSSSSRATTPSIRLSTPSGMSAMTIDGVATQQSSGGTQLGGVSSGGSVNSEAPGVVLRHPKRPDHIPTDPATVKSPSRQHYQQLQQRRWSEYTDIRTNGQFIRSASARLPRQRYQDEENDEPQAEDHRQRSTSDVREGERKIQQREESMKRLLEWKQRMLQSPLTRKPSGSSTRGTAQNELSKYYKQQVLRELATQEARNRDEARTSRRKPQPEDINTIPGPGRASMRSRSQDGRRSSTSLNRYNSFSSDDEEVGDVRKARKRVRRPSQAGRSRQGSTEGKCGRRHPPSASHSAPNYENVSLSNSSKVPSSIPPDASYGDDHHFSSSKSSRSKNYSKSHGPESGKRSDEHKGSRSKEHRTSVDCNVSLSDNKCNMEMPLIVSSSKPLKYPDCQLRSGNNAVKSSGDSTSTGYPSLQDDRYSCGKHSDSGYDTLQAGKAFLGGQDISDLLKIRKSEVNMRRYHEMVYPIHDVQYNKSSSKRTSHKEDKDSKAEDTNTKDIENPGKESEEGNQKPKRYQRVETPPKNIVQSRIKVFEVSKEEEGSTDTATTRESLQMQEPLKMSPPMYQPNEAHVSSLRSTDLSSDIPFEENRRGVRSDLRSFVFGDMPSDMNIPSPLLKDYPVHSPSRKAPGESYNKNTKSVRDLLADFERKSQLIKAAEEERSNESGPGKRCVFSDTETLLYDTSSDAEAPPSSAAARSASRCGPLPVSDEDDDKDEEVAAALGKRDKFFSSCRDLGRSRDPEFFTKHHRNKKTSKTSTATTPDPGSEDVEVIMTPGYLRLSMAESLVTHEDSDSLCSTPTNPPLIAEDMKKDGNDKPSDVLSTNVEEHYMPMTPSRKAVLAPLPDAFGSPSASHTILMESIFGGGVEMEESAYVEMTEEGIVRSLLAPDPNPSFLSKLDLKRLNSRDSTATYATPESPRYCEIGSVFKDNKGVASHYELLYRASSHYEPVYMEVSPLMLKSRDSSKVPDKSMLDENKKDASESSTLQDSSEKSRSGEEDGVEPLPPTPPRASLPDILNSSSNSNQQQKTDRDSSDADDEASKDLDSLDAPRHPRFSLSDTFRPASYYLGASSMSDRSLMVIGGVTTSTVEHHDSSDSDLVSPPPIPTSPPPLDDFDNSLELQDSSLDIKTKSLPVSLKCSKSEDKDDARRLWSKTPLHIKDRSSNQVDELLAPSAGDVSSSGSESIELRNNAGDAQSPERLMKRRPVSDDIIDSLEDSPYILDAPFQDRRTGSDLESIGSRSGLAIDLEDGVSIDLDQYLEDLQARDPFNVDVYSKEFNYAYYRTYPKEPYGFNETVSSTDKSSHKSDSSVNKPEVSSQRSYNRGRASDPLPQSSRADFIRTPERHRQFERQAEEEVHYENIQISIPPPLPTSPPPDLPPSERLDRQIASTSTPHQTTSDNMKRFLGAHYSGIKRSETEPVPTRGKSLSMDEQQLQQAGAPYYYSDLLKGDDDGFTSSTSEKSISNLRSVGGYPSFVSSSVPVLSRSVTSSRSQPLNNQRGDIVDVNCLVKRNDIGRKVNPIHHSPQTSATFSQHSQQSSEDESRRLAAELRDTTVHFLGAAGKRGQVDERNLYEADTIQRRKALQTAGVREQEMYRSRTPDFHQTANNVNLYPHGLRDKSSPSQNELSTRSSTHQPQRRSRSLEGLLDGPDFLHSFTDERHTSGTASGRPLHSAAFTTSLTNVPQSVSTFGFTPSSERSTIQEVQLATGQILTRSRPPPPLPEEPQPAGPCEGDDLWEQDALWRESLRRVSLRHTRSLDNLDGGRGRSNSRLSNTSAATTSTMTQSAISSDLLSQGGCPRQRLSREVTYVNDSMARGAARQREYEEDYREGRRRPRRRPIQGRPGDGLTERDDGVHYERLSRYSESLERTRRGETYIEGYVWDEDREVFRKDGRPREDANQQRSQPFLEDGSLPPQPPPSFEIDREKLRQWDLMSSAPLLQRGVGRGLPRSGMLGAGFSGGGAGAGVAVTRPTDEQDNEEQDERPPSSVASGSGSVIGRDPLPPRAVSTMSIQQQQLKNTQPPAITLTTEDKTTASLIPSDQGSGGSKTVSPSGGQGPTNHAILPGSGSQHGPPGKEPNDTNDSQGKRAGGHNSPWGLNVSAGELLGRTHEELVLLLIQLRRQSAGVCKAMETCHMEIEAQARLAELETPKRLEHLKKLEELKKHLLDLEKQYEKGKPLVNLVDNMVKLGSLYRGSSTQLQTGLVARDRLEFNQKVQEQRLLAEERKDWDRLNPDRGQLQAKVQELYRLDRLLQEESGTLQSLQQDKELLEKALGGLKHKLQVARTNPAEAERYRKQQRLLERELSRVRMLLAHNSKKLEETVAENARLEQELLVLRQKLQASRRGSQTLQRVPASLIADSTSMGTTAALEAELRRVQQLVGDLQRQRQELSVQVRQLTEKSHSLVQQIRPGPTGAGPIPGRKRHHSTWLETDLDSLVTLDHGLDSPVSPQHQTSPPGSKSGPPDTLYVNTETTAKRREPNYEGPVMDGDDAIPPPLPAPPEMPPDYPPPPPPPPPPSEEAMMNGGISPEQQYCSQMDISEADDRMKRFYGIIPREKQQEIKTVRIVKRESERRQRDRDRSGNIGIPLTNGTGTCGKRVTISDDTDPAQPHQLEQKQHLGRVLEEETPETLHLFQGDSVTLEDDPVLSQFQRSMSLPRGFGKRERLVFHQQGNVIPPPPPVRVPSPRSDSVTALRNLMINRHRVRFESCSGGSSSAESTHSVSPSMPRPLTAHEQLFGMASPASSDASPQLSPVFKSEAARAIVMEMSTMREQPRKRIVPKEKRRHYTVSSSRPLLDMESTFPTMGSARSRDDLDMERALRPRLNAPDVVRSTMSHKDFKYNEDTIDSILGTPNKIVIPERYIPEQAPELSAEEQLHRHKKAESIRKMLSETTALTTSDGKEPDEEEQTSTLKKKVAADKKQREHLLQLNQILAKQVMEKSKMVAGSTSVQPQE